MRNIYDYYITQDEYAEAERNGIQPYNVDRRIRDSGWTKQKTITFPLRTQVDRSHMKHIWTAHGITYKQFIARLHIGWDEWSAATVPLRDNDDLLEQCKWMSSLQRKHPKEIVDLAAKNGIKAFTFYSRMKSGWSHEKASTLPPSRSNSAMILKQKYGEDYFKN